MKQLKLTFVLTVFMSMVGLQAFAAWDTSTKVEVNGVYYYLDKDNNLAQVTSGIYYYSYYSYSNISIPSTFRYQGNTYSVTSIGDYVFSDCSKLTSVTIPNSVTSIGWRAFEGCSGLTSIEIPNSVTSIGGCAFQNCSSLTSVTIGNSVTSIGNYAFQNCSDLKSVTIGNSVRSIGNYAFEDCSDLKSIEIPNSVKSIGERAFSGCISLSSVTIGNSVTSIGEYAFFQNFSLTSVICEATSVPSTGSNVFYNSHYDRATLYVPFSALANYRNTSPWRNFGTIRGISFHIGDIYYSLDNDTKQAIVISGDTKYTGSVTIPSTITYNGMTYNVTSIGDGAFLGCSDLHSVKIPNSVTSIDEGAFSECTGLTSIIVESGNTKYDSRDNCNAIIETATNTLVVGFNNTIIPNGVTSIGDFAFLGCSGLTSVTIPNSVTSIGDWAFSDCSGLTSVTIGNSVTSIGEWAFYDCSGLTSIICEATSVPSIEYDVFADVPQSEATLYVPNSALEDYKATAPWSDFGTIIAIDGENDISGSCGEKINYSLNLVTGVLSITGTGAMADYSSDSSAPWYSYNSDIKTVNIADGVTSIGSYAFSGCSGLTSVTIGNSVKSIGIYAFSDCTRLPYITIPNSVTSIGGRTFSGCTSLISVNIPDSVTVIIGKTFYGCSNLTSITIPNGVTRISDEAFYNCSGLTSIYIPNSVTSIGNRAFSGCSRLISVTCKATSVPSTGSNVFDNVPQSSATLYVPGFAMANYKKTSPWSNFGKIKGISLHIDGIYYSLDNDTKQALVISGDTKYTGSVTFPATVTYNGMTYSVTLIGIDAFNGCSGLTSIEIPEGVTSIGENAFSGCSSLTSVTIPNSVKSVGKDAFKNCSSLQKVIVSDIAAWCGISFGNASGNPLYYAKHLYRNESTEIKDLVIPNSVTSIKFAAFYGCSSLTSVTIPNSVTSIGKSAFCYCSGLTSVTIGNSVTSIGDYAFQYCSDLNSITIPNSVKSIGNYAFQYCSDFTSVTIPNSVTSIGNNAFDGVNIPTVVSLIENPFAISDKTSDFRTFTQNTFINATLYVPKGTIEKYKAAYGWNDFSNIVELPVVRGDVNGDGEVNVGDLVSVSNYMAGDGSVSKDAADVNEDGEVNVGDMVVISNIMSGNE